MDYVNPNPLDRLLTALRNIIRAETSAVKFLAYYEYKVVSSSKNTVDCTPMEELPLPGLTKVPILLPFSLMPAPGDTVIIQFSNGDPGKPRAVGFSVPPRLLLGSINNNSPDAARKADSVTWNILPLAVNGIFQSGAGSPIPPPTPPTLSPFVINPGTPFTGSMIPTVPRTFGSITIGSSKVGTAT